MKKYIVTGYAGVIVEVEVEAKNKEDAIEKAYDNVYIDSYRGNGGSNKLIGVCDTDEATADIYVVDELEYKVVEELE